MENDVGANIRIPKHPRWSPSPVDLSVSNTLNSPPPALTNQSNNNSHPLASHLSGLGLSGLAPHQLSALGSLNSQLNLGTIPGLTLNSLSSLNASAAPLLSNYSAKSPLNGNILSNASSHLTSPSPIFSSRKQREFIPDNKKDDSYWDRRRRNNEAAKRSREKRRISDMVLESKVLELTRENTILKSELYAIKDKFGLPTNVQFTDNENSLMGGLSDNRGRRDKIIKTLMNAGNENSLLNLHPQLNANSSTNSMINALNGTSTNSLLHSIGNGFGNVNSQNSSNGSNGRNYMSCSPHSSDSNSTSPQLNCNNSSLNSTNSSSTCTNNNSTSGILSINKNMNNTDRQNDEHNNLNELNSKTNLSAFYSNGQSLLNHSSLIAAYHEQNGRRNSSDHEEENNINNLNSLINSSNNNNNNNKNNNKDQNSNQSMMMSSLELMDKCRLNHFNDDQKTFGHLGVNKSQLSEQECAALSATLEKANRLFEENLGQSNSLPFKLRHKARNSPNNDQISDASSETGLDSPLCNEQNRKNENNLSKKDRSEGISEEDEDEFIEVELSDEETAGNKRTKERKEQQNYHRNSFPSTSSDSESEKFQKVIDSKKFNAQSTLNLFRNLASLPNGRSTITAFTPYSLNCQLNNALQYADQ